MAGVADGVAGVAALMNFANRGSTSDELASSLRYQLEVVVVEILIHSLLEGATRAIGTVAVIDVFAPSPPLPSP